MYMYVTATFQNKRVGGGRKKKIKKSVKCAIKGNNEYKKCYNDTFQWFEEKTTTDNCMI